MAGEVPYTEPHVQLVASIIRLACGVAVPLGGAGGIGWVDAGTDPRNRGYGDAPDHLRKQVQAKRKLLEQRGWTVPTEPVPLSALATLR